MESVFRGSVFWGGVEILTVTKITPVHKAVRWVNRCDRAGYEIL